MYSEDARISTLRVRIKKYFRVDKFVFPTRFTQVARYMIFRYETEIRHGWRQQPKVGTGTLYVASRR